MLYVNRRDILTMVREINDLGFTTDIPSIMAVGHYCIDRHIIVSDSVFCLACVACASGKKFKKTLLMA